MLQFSKFHGAGNDFIIIDDREAAFDTTNTNLIKFLCDRHFGIGADGLMLLRNHPDYDFEMIYFNSDGNQSSMCGNGGRCIAAFAQMLGIVNETAQFLAIDGQHRAIGISTTSVSLEMKDVNEVEDVSDNEVVLDTGSPHFVKKVDGLSDMNLKEEARAIRYSTRFAADGINVNFVEIENGEVRIRTYERGVEDETLACGTGVTAAAIAINHWGLLENEIAVSAIGGDLKVSYSKTVNGYENIWKTGPVQHVFDGNYSQ